MCRAIEDGGRRCVGNRHQFEEKVKLLEQKVKKKKEILAKLDARREDKNEITPERYDDLSKRWVTENDLRRRWESHLEELKAHWDQSDEGMNSLRAEIEQNSADRPRNVLLQARLEEAEKARAEAAARRTKVAIRDHNLVATMEGEGYTDAQIDEMLQKLRDAYNEKTAPSESTLRGRLEAAQAVWDAVNPGGEDFEEHEAKKRRIAETASLPSEERINLIKTAISEFAVKKSTAKQEFVNARGLYDSTAGGRKELKEQISKAEKDDRLKAISALRGRLISAEARRTLIRNADSARGRLKRELTSLAEARGADPQKVWNALKSIHPLDRDGFPLKAPDPADRKQTITVAVTQKDYAEIQEDFTKTEGYNADSSPADQKAAFQAYVSSLVSSTDYKAFHSSKSVLEANADTPTGSTGHLGRNTTDAAGRRRDINLRIAVTQKQAQNLKALSSHIETSMSSAARRLALGGREDLFAIQNDRSNDRHWRKQTAAAQEYLGEAVTENFR